MDTLLAVLVSGTLAQNFWLMKQLWALNKKISSCDYCKLGTGQRK